MSHKCLPIPVLVLKLVACHRFCCCCFRCSSAVDVSTGVGLGRKLGDKYFPSFSLGATSLDHSMVYKIGVVALIKPLRIAKSLPPEKVLLCSSSNNFSTRNGPCTFFWVINRKNSNTKKPEMNNNNNTQFLQ